MADEDALFTFGTVPEEAVPPDEDPLFFYGAVPEAVPCNAKDAVSTVLPTRLPPPAHVCLPSPAIQTPPLLSSAFLESSGGDSRPQRSSVPDSAAADESMGSSACGGQSGLSAAQIFLARRETSGRRDRRGGYDRTLDKYSDSKRRSHQRIGQDHYEQVHENFSIGRPCKESCQFNRECGRHMTPVILQRCHEKSFGDITDTKLSKTQKQTHATWKELAMNAIAVSAKDGVTKEERFMVDGVGPVCPTYWAAAYGLTSHAALQILADARSLLLRAEADFADAAGDDATAIAGIASASAEETIEWWRLWLTLEDQMPNELAIIHRAVIWQAVYEEECESAS